ncbi:hypothetical protein GH714_032808 [Hevea brasiliensis]|uniref:Uncharacterized protein n=1 Tax=Hevea brasiliensis TaxID=3981 RepID=A0A6A6L275_HEVBR|nr:hypothetical protein GH714_032808 [Hevea brasiliensis]
MLQKVVISQEFLLDSWNSLWALVIPPRIKIFCGRCEETTSHLFLQCPVVARVVATGLRWWQEYKEYQAKVTVEQQSSSRPQSWLAPADEFFKLNTDAAITGRGIVGLGNAD